MPRESRGSVPGNQARGHMDGFEKAFADALKRASSNTLGTGTKDVEVHFHANVTVTNPGVVNEYVATLVSPN